MKHELKLKQELIDALARLAHVARTEPAKAGDALAKAQDLAGRLKGEGHPHIPPGQLEQLAEELATWQAKLGVILKEPVGREGMAKHAHHWIEELKKC